MKESAIIEGNSIIANFMGWQEEDMGGKKYYQVNERFQPFVTDLKFHSDWNWLFRVIDKIEAIERNPLHGYKMIIGRYCVIEKSGGGDSYELIEVNSHNRTRIEMAWKCVVDFIKWYNKKIKQ